MDFGQEKQYAGGLGAMNSATAQQRISLAGSAPTPFAQNIPEDAPRAIGGVSEALAGSDRISSALLEEIAALEQRLSNVLRPNPPAGNAGAEVARTSSLMAQGLRELNDRLATALSAVRSIAARVDL